LEDEVLAQMLLEYGFLTEEQIEDAIKKQKESSESRTLNQYLVQEGTLTVRALKTLHSAHQRRLESKLQEEAVRRRTDMQKRRTQTLIRKPLPPEKKDPGKDKPAKVGFGIKKESKEPEKEDFKPVTLTGLKEEVDNLREQLKLIREELKQLKSGLTGELEAYLRGKLEELKN
jgi:polyhydroxyalkanoate synthesis regulator phasin